MTDIQDIYRCCICGYPERLPNCIVTKYEGYHELLRPSVGDTRKYYEMYEGQFTCQFCYDHYSNNLDHDDRIVANKNGWLFPLRCMQYRCRKLATMYIRMPYAHDDCFVSKFYCEKHSNGVTKSNDQTFCTRNNKT